MHPKGVPLIRVDTSSAVKENLPLRYRKAKELTIGIYLEWYGNYVVLVARPIAQVLAPLNLELQSGGSIGYLN